MQPRNRLITGKLLLLFCSLCLLVACGGDGGGVTDGDNGDDGGSGSIPATSAAYTLLAWNDLGMHCLNPTYDTLVILPPYNTVWAQLVKRGTPPQLVKSGVTLEYTMVNNTSSVSKADPKTGSVFSQFWDNALVLFGVALPDDKGLNLVTPKLHNGLSGVMVPVGDHFEVDGIPLTPIDDDGIWNPYQVIEITARNSSGTILATTRATVPTSDEINCGKCHGADAFANILLKHDAKNRTNLTGSTPVLCAECHGSPALGTSGPGSSGLYLSEAIHGSHAGRTSSCYDCHPGVVTKCNRSLAHNTSADGNCSDCHGGMRNVADTITKGGRVPWVTEPKCSDCHVNIAEVDTGTTLYRNAVGHGGMNCAACHGSPHAMVPSREASDNYQAIQYQGKALTLGSCAVCHSRARGDGSREFIGEHGGTRHPSACAVCHVTITSGNTALWPHHYEWTNH